MGLFDKLKNVAEVAKKAIDDSGVADIAKSKLQEMLNGSNSQTEDDGANCEKIAINYTVVTEFELSPVSDNGYEIIKYFGFDEPNMEIPSVIDGKKIAGIGNGAFGATTFLKNVKLCDGIEYIDTNAFYNCEELEGVDLPLSLNKIGEYAFAKSGIKAIEIPDTVSVIGKECFANCENLVYAKLPAPMDIIPESCFSECENLKKVIMPEAVAVIKHGAFISCDKLKLDKVPETCVVIEDYALSGPDFKTDELILPKSLEVIGEMAIGGDKSYSKMVIPASVKEVGKMAFNAECEEIYIEDGATFEMPDSLFVYCCNDAKKLVIPSSITEIGRIFGQMKETRMGGYVTDEYGRRVFDEDGKPIWESHDLGEHWEDDIPEELTIYCDAGSAAMEFARKYNIPCAKIER